MKDELKKRLHADTICTIIITVATTITGLLRMISFITLLPTAGNKANGFEEVRSSLNDSVCHLFIGAALILLCIILGGIRKNGEPFAAKNVKLMRAMSIILCIGSVMPIFNSLIVDFLDPNFVSRSIDFFALIDYAMLIFAVVVGIVSEIFTYGVKLQADADSIA